MAGDGASLQCGHEANCDGAQVRLYTLMYLPQLSNQHLCVRARRRDRVAPCVVVKRTERQQRQRRCGACVRASVRGVRRALTSDYPMRFQHNKMLARSSPPPSRGSAEAMAVSTSRSEERSCSVSVFRTEEAWARDLEARECKEAAQRLLQLGQYESALPLMPDLSSSGSRATRSACR